MRLPCESSPHASRVLHSMRRIARAKLHESGRYADRMTAHVPSRIDDGTQIPPQLPRAGVVMRESLDRDGARRRTLEQGADNEQLPTLGAANRGEARRRFVSGGLRGWIGGFGNGLLFTVDCDANNRRVDAIVHASRRRESVAGGEGHHQSQPDCRESPHLHFKHTRGSLIREISAIQAGSHENPDLADGPAFMADEPVNADVVARPRA
jgi:hypothetical protein